MDWTIFFVVLLFGWYVIAAQAFFAWQDGWFSQTRLQCRGVRNAYAFPEHGGMRADVFLITPLVAYLSGKYYFACFSFGGLAVLAVSSAVWYILVRFIYEPGGVNEPEAYTHYGKTTAAGWLHAIFAALATWVMAMAYLGLAVPVVTRGDLLLLSAVLTPFFYYGVKKFNPRWVFKPQDKIQVGASVALVWIVTGIKLWYMKG